jgi:hypothetical protein
MNLLDALKILIQHERNISFTPKYHKENGRIYNLDFMFIDAETVISTAKEIEAE